MRIDRCRSIRKGNTGGFSRISGGFDRARDSRLTRGAVNLLPRPARRRGPCPASPSKPPPSSAINPPKRIDRNPPAPPPRPCRCLHGAERLRLRVRIGCKHRRQHHRIHSPARGLRERPGRVRGSGDSKFVEGSAEGRPLPPPLREMNALRPHLQRQGNAVGNEQNQPSAATQRGDNSGEVFALRMPVVPKDDPGAAGKRLDNRQRIWKPCLVGDEQKVRKISLAVQESDFFCPRPICLASRERVVA